MKNFKTYILLSFTALMLLQLLSCEALKRAFNPTPIILLKSDTTFVVKMDTIHEKFMVAYTDTVETKVVKVDTVRKKDTLLITKYKNVYLKPKFKPQTEGIILEYLGDTVIRASFKPKDRSVTAPLNSTVRLPEKVIKPSELGFWGKLWSWQIWLPALVIGFIFGFILRSLIR